MIKIDSPFSVFDRWSSISSTLTGDGLAREISSKQEVEEISLGDSEQREVTTRKFDNMVSFWVREQVRVWCPVWLRSK